jgi:hypothetical protein
MADEEKKSDKPAADKSSETATPKEDPSPTVSASEPAPQDVPSTAQDKGHDHAHGHDDHAHGDDDQAHGHDDHAHDASGADFGEVIPEKNWQEQLLVGVAVLALIGFILVAVVWNKVQPPAENTQEESATHELTPAPVLTHPLPGPPVDVDNPPGSPHVFK